MGGWTLPAARGVLSPPHAFGLDLWLQPVGLWCQLLSLSEPEHPPLPSCCDLERVPPWPWPIWTWLVSLALWGSADILGIFTPPAAKLEWEVVFVVQAGLPPGPISCASSSLHLCVEAQKDLQ